MLYLLCGGTRQTDRQSSDFCCFFLCSCVYDLFPFKTNKANVSETAVEKYINTENE
jgi:hypothetical protein